MENLEIKGSHPDKVFDGDSACKVYFQFGDEEKVQLATVYDNGSFILKLDHGKSSNPSVNFTDGNGNQFKLFMECI